MFIAQRFLSGSQWSASQWIDIVGEDGEPDFSTANEAKNNAFQMISSGNCGIVNKIRIIKVMSETSL